MARETPTQAEARRAEMENTLIFNPARHPRPPRIKIKPILFERILALVSPAWSTRRMRDRLRFEAASGGYAGGRRVRSRGVQ